MTFGQALTLCALRWEFLKTGDKVNERAAAILSAVLGDGFRKVYVEDTDPLVFFRHWRTIGNGPATMNRKKSILSQVYREAGVEIRMGHFKEPPPRQCYFSSRQWSDIVGHYAFTEVQRVLCMFLYATGCRISEALALAVEDIDPEPVSGVYRVTFHNTKNGTSRRVFISSELYYAIRGLRGEAAVFNVSYDHFQRRFRDVLEDLGITGSVHTIRHTAASRLAEGGIPLYAISMQLGHKSVKTTERYLHLMSNSSMLDCARELAGERNLSESGRDERSLSQGYG